MSLPFSSEGLMLSMRNGDMLLAAGLGSMTDPNYTSLLYDNMYTFQFFLKSLKCQPKPSIPSNHLIGHGVQYTLGLWCQRYQAEKMEGTQGNTHETGMLLSPAYKWLRKQLGIQNVDTVLSNMGAEIIGRWKKD
jgi:hypothetical protein